MKKMFIYSGHTLYLRLIIVCSLCHCRHCILAQLLPSQAAGSARSQIVMLSKDGGCAAGIIAGYDDKNLYIATAAHVRDALLKGPGQVQVTFEGPSHERRQGTFLPESEAKATGDLITLKLGSDDQVNKLIDGLDFRMLSPVPLPPAHSPVTSIGCYGGGEWSTGSNETLLSPDHSYLRFESNVGEGQSGGGLFNQAWELIGMPLEVGPNGVYARPIEPIIESLNRWQVPVQLMVRPLSGRTRGADEFAREEALLARSQQFVSYAVESLGEDPERSILLAIEAVNTTVKNGQPPLEAAVNALHQAILGSRVLLRLRDESVSESVDSIDVSRDGKYIATGAVSGTSIWDSVNGRRLAKFGGLAMHQSVAFSPDGQRVAATEDHDVAKIWYAVTAKELVTIKGHKGIVDSVAFSPDGTGVATGSYDGTAKIWDAGTGQLLMTLSEGKGSLGSLYCVAFSPDAKRVATGGFDHTASIWDLVSGKKVMVLRHTSIVYAVAFSSNSKWIATGCQDGSAELWDASSGKELLNLTGHLQNVTSVAFSPDSTRVATSSYDGTAKIWSSTTGQELATLRGHLGEQASTAFAGSGILNAIVFSPDGNQLMTAGSDGTVRIWNAIGGRAEVTISDDRFIISSIAYSPDGRRIVTSSAWEARIWDAQTGSPVMVSGPSGSKTELVLKGHDGAIDWLGYSPDGKHKATAARDKTLRIWNDETGKQQLTLRGVSSTYEAFSHDGTRLAAVSGNQVDIWDLGPGKVLRTLEVPQTSMPEMARVAFTGDGKHLVTLSMTGMLRIWDIDKGQILHAFSGNQMDFGTGLAISPDGKLMATTGSEHSVTLWDVATWREVLVLRGNYFVNEIAFSPDGKLLATANRLTAKVWDLSTGEERMELPGHSDLVTSLAFSPDGKRLATASNAKQCRLRLREPLYRYAV